MANVEGFVSFASCPVKLNPVPVDKLFLIIVFPNENPDAFPSVPVVPVFVGFGGDLKVELVVLWLFSVEGFNPADVPVPKLNDPEALFSFGLPKWKPDILILEF